MRIEVVPRITCAIRVALLDPDGSEKIVSYRPELIVTSGKTLFGDLLREEPLTTALRAIAIGTSNSAPAIGQTILGAEWIRKAVPAAGTNNAGPGAAHAVNIRSGSQVTIGVSLGPGLDGRTYNEIGFFGSIIELANPTTAPVCTPSTSGGTLAAGTYTVSYSWKNANGETQEVVTTGVVITGSTGSIAVTVPALPAGATHSRIYAAIGASRLRITDITGTSFTITTLSGSSGSPSGSNTTLRPGIIDSGVLFDRALMAQPGGLTPTAGQYIYGQGVLNFA